MSAVASATLEHLSGAIALGEGFQFHIVACDSPRQVEYLVHELEDQVSSRLGRPVQVHLAAPQMALPRDAPLDGSVLAAWVMDRLERFAVSDRHALDIIVLDCTSGSAEDGPAWRQLFRRMNEQRNALLAAVGCSLVLCAPEWLESLFAQEAPDFWSIRGVSIALEQDGATSPGAQHETRTDLVTSTGERDLDVALSSLSERKYRVDER